MSDYNQYVNAINKIFDYLKQMRNSWDDLDNKNYIESIEEYKQVILNSLEMIKSSKVNDSNNVEALDND